MDICLISRYFDLRNAGIGRVSYNLRDGLSNCGHNVRDIYTTKEGVLNYLKYSLWDLKHSIPKDYSIYHSITPVESLWIPKEKSVVTVHDLILLRDKKYLGSGVGYSTLAAELATIYFSLCLEAASKCSKIVFVSETVREEFLIHFDRLDIDKTVVIHSGINSDLDYIKAYRNSNKDSLTIGYLGQLDKRKRVDLLIKEFSRSRYKSWYLKIGGDGIDREKVKSLVKEANISLLGQIPDFTLPSFFNSLDFFVSPTIAEGYGLPLVEAMACKVPPVVFQDADIPKEIKSRCIVLEDMSKLYQLESTTFPLERLEDNYTFAKNHKWENTILEYEKVYKEICS